MAADVWALFAKETDGLALSQAVHDQLKACNIWVWSEGCIEDVTGAANKGEDAIIEQEEQLRIMSAEEIEKEMPAFKACFEWIRGL